MTICFIIIRPLFVYSDRLRVYCLAFQVSQHNSKIQQRSVGIIFGNELDFEILAVILYDIPLLADRRDRQKDSCLLSCKIHYTVNTE